MLKMNSLCWWVSQRVVPKLNSATDMNWWFYVTIKHFSVKCLCALLTHLCVESHSLSFFKLAPFLFLCRFHNSHSHLKRHSILPFSPSIEKKNYDIRQNLDAKHKSSQILIQLILLLKTQIAVKRKKKTFEECVLNILNKFSLLDLLLIAKIN